MMLHALNLSMVYITPADKTENVLLWKFNVIYFNLLNQNIR